MHNEGERTAMALTTSERPDERVRTFEVDLARPGVQRLLRILVEVQRELERKYPTAQRRKAS